MHSGHGRRQFARRATGVLACAVVTFGLGAAAATAMDVPSSVTVLGTEEFKRDATVYGLVTSGKPKCRANRKVRLTLIKAGGNRVLDVGRTSDNGAWTVRGTPDDFAGTEAVAAKLLAKKVKSGRKTLKCASDSDVFP